jgi:hypothetical protein
VIFSTEFHIHIFFLLLNPEIVYSLSRNALKAYVFLVEWLISTEENLSRKVQSEKIPVVREKVGQLFFSTWNFRRSSLWLIC